MKIRLPKGMTMEQLRAIRATYKNKPLAPYKYRCAECGQRFPCAHVDSDSKLALERAIKQ